MKALAIIPARGGSKGIPMKNIRLLCGKPLIAWNIEASLKSRFTDRTVVSTDDLHIASISRMYGAEVVMRPPEISDDFAPSESALMHVLDQLDSSEGYRPDIIVFLQCTSPLTSAEDIDGAVENLIMTGADSAFSATPFHYFLWRSRTGTSEAEEINHDRSTRLLRQEREPQFLENGAIYVMKSEGFKKARHRFFGRTSMYVMPNDRSLEIDEPLDLEIAEFLLRRTIGTERMISLPESVELLVMDFDGVFTDNRVTVFQDGREAVVCSRSDGMGITMLKKTGLDMLVVSKEQNAVVSARCSKLGIVCHQGIDDKETFLQHYLSSRNIEPVNVVYLGNDINDLGCMKMVGCSVAVGDAHSSVIAEAKIVLNNGGGNGAVRELCDMIIKRMKMTASKEGK